MSVKQNILAKLSPFIRWKHRLKGSSRFNLDALPKNLTITGFFGEGFGLGRAAELTALGFEKQGFKVIRHNVRSVLNSPITRPQSIPGAQDDGWIIHVNPPETLALFSKLKSGAYPQGIRIGYWAWELDKAPSNWIRTANLFNLVFTPSRFCTQAFQRLPIPFETLAHPVSLRMFNFEPKYTNAASVKKPFTFFLQMDGLSSFTRKNALTAIEAFKTRLGHRQDTRLVLKTQRLSTEHYEAVDNAIQNHSNIRHLSKRLSEDEYSVLCNEIDCVVSSHRSEGFGLSLAEAIFTGKFVLATGWSGNLDFMPNQSPFLINYHLRPVETNDDVYGTYAPLGCKWAECSVSHLAQSMEALVNAPSEFEAERQKLVQAALHNEQNWSRLRPTD